MRFSSLSIVLASVSLAACGGGGDDDDDTVTPVIDAAQTLTDAATQTDAPSSACTVSTENFGNLGDLSAAGVSTYAPPEGTESYGLVTNMMLESAEPTDILSVQFWDGYAPFETGGFRTGTFQLTGAQTSYATCGTCVTMITNATAEGSDGTFMVTGGTLTVSQVATDGAAGTMLTFSLADLQFQHVTIAEDFETTPVGDGCTTAIGSATFSGTVMPPSMGKRGVAALRVNHSR